MENLTTTNARKEFFDLVRGAIERHEIYHINHRNGDVVLLSEDKYDGLVESIELLSSTKFREDCTRSKNEAESGETFGFEDVFGESQ